MRSLSPLDRLLAEIDYALRTTMAQPATTERPYPARNVAEPEPLTDEERQLSGRLMRINHAGEVAAQGLYRGQALTAQLPEVRAQMERSALEENDHLDWCGRRLDALESHKSVFNPVWYWASFSIGAAAGLAGDQWSLGFVRETELQVEQHLNKHLGRLPAHDLPSMAVLQQMKADEVHHGQLAEQAGGRKLPWPIRRLMMPLVSKVMTAVSYRF